MIDERAILGAQPQPRPKELRLNRLPNFLSVDTDELAQPRVARLVVNPHVLRRVLHPSLTEAPSLERRSPASSVLRPLRHPTRPGLSLTSCQLIGTTITAGGFPCCLWSPMRTCHRHYPGRVHGACSLIDLHCQRPSPCNSKVGSCNCFFGALLSVHSCYGLHARGVAKRPFTPKAPTALLPPLPLRLLPGGANQFPGGTCTR